MVNCVSPRNNALLGIYFHMSYDLNIEAYREPALIWFSNQGWFSDQLRFGLVARVGAQASFDSV